MDNLRAQNLGRVLIVHVRCSESIQSLISGNTKGGSITVTLTSSLTGLESAV